jgi:hypothetical protein
MSQISVSTFASTPAGTYSSVAVYKSYLTGQTAGLTVTVVVTP